MRGLNFNGAAMLAEPNPQQQAEVKIAAPINDVQIVALVAAQLDDAQPGHFDAHQRVSRAISIIGEAAAAVAAGEVKRAVDSAVRRANAITATGERG